MTIPAAYAITADSLTAETFRQAPGSMIAGTGVVGSGDLAVSQNGTPNMSVNVAAGQIWIPGTLASTTGFPTNLNAQTTYGLPSAFNEQGPYYGWNNGTVNETISAADPTNPRIDLIVAYIQDAEYAGSNNQPVIGVVTGTPAASPSPPSAPASAVVLAQVAVAAGVSSILNANITDERRFLTLSAGFDRPRLIGEAGFLVGTPPTVGKAAYYWQTGTVLGTTTGFNIAVTFPTAFANGVASLLITPASVTGGVTGTWTFNVAACSKTGFTLETSENTLAVEFCWLAVGF